MRLQLSVRFTWSLSGALAANEALGTLLSNFVSCTSSTLIKFQQRYVKSHTVFYKWPEVLLAAKTYGSVFYEKWSRSIAVGKWCRNDVTGETPIPPLAFQAYRCDLIIVHGNVLPRTD
jgi:hypothetical protein